MGKKHILNYFYPILFVLYPILALRQANVEYVNYSVIIRSIGLTLLVTSTGWLLLRSVLKDWHKAGILTMSGMLLFYSYGHVYLWAAEESFGPLRHRTLIGFFILISFVTAYLVIRLKDLSGLVRFLNVTGVVLIGLILIQSALYAFQVEQAAEAAREKRSQTVVSGLGRELPDIYLIILDAYTRSDVLKESYQYDNSTFISSLEEMGFYVATCSQSNYPGTNLSIISLMNLNYFFNLFDEAQKIPPLNSSLVNETLRGLGYTIVAFENRASGHFDLMEDVYLSRNATVLENVAIGGGINEFESMLIETSFLRIFVDMPQLLPSFLAGDVKDAEFYEHYLQTIYILEELKNLPAMPGPKFVLAHILTPHDPFIFNADGSYEPSGAQGPVVGYRNNVSFVDNFMPQTLKAIIEDSEIPPIIIVQGDHGPTGGIGPPESRMFILNAYHIGEEYIQNLYPTITPVNSFRVIFNSYFDTQYPLLEDHSYYLWNRSQMLDQDNEIINQCQP